jgi:thymidylate synthase
MGVGEMSLLDERYKKLCTKVLTFGYHKTSRVGDTISLPGQSLSTAPLYEAFPLLTTRRIYYKGVLGELAAFLQKATTVAEFESQGCKYWRHNAEAWKAGDGETVGRIYGSLWRDWRGTQDQLREVLLNLAKDLDGRRHIVTAWDPLELDKGCLPPCHILFQFYVHNNILDCVVYMRSVDLALGLPSDLALYGALLVVATAQTGLRAGRLHFHFGDAHIYTGHVYDLQKQLKREPLDTYPRYAVMRGTTIDNFKADSIEISNYSPMDAIKYELY